MIKVNSAINDAPYNLKSVDEFIDHIKKLTSIHENDFDGDFEEMTVSEFRDSIKDIYLTNVDERVGL